MNQQEKSILPTFIFPFNHNTNDMSTTTFNITPTTMITNENNEQNTQAVLNSNERTVMKTPNVNDRRQYQRDRERGKKEHKEDDIERTSMMRKRTEQTNKTTHSVTSFSNSQYNCSNINDSMSKTFFNSNNISLSNNDYFRQYESLSHRKTHYLDDSDEEIINDEIIEIINYDHYPTLIERWGDDTKPIIKQQGQFKIEDYVEFDEIEPTITEEISYEIIYSGDEIKSTKEIHRSYSQTRNFRKIKKRRIKCKRTAQFFNEINHDDLSGENYQILSSITHGTQSPNIDLISEDTTSQSFKSDEDSFDENEQSTSDIYFNNSILSDQIKNDTKIIGDQQQDLPVENFQPSIKSEELPISIDHQSPTPFESTEATSVHHTLAAPLPLNHPSVDLKTETIEQKPSINSLIEITQQIKTIPLALVSKTEDSTVQYTCEDKKQSDSNIISTTTKTVQKPSIEETNVSSNTEEQNDEKSITNLTTEVVKQPETIFIQLTKIRIPEEELSKQIDTSKHESIKTAEGITSGGPQPSIPSKNKEDEDVELSSDFLVDIVRQITTSAVTTHLPSDNHTEQLIEKLTKDPLTEIAEQTSFPSIPTTNIEANELFKPISEDETKYLSSNLLNETTPSLVQSISHINESTSLVTDINAPTNSTSSSQDTLPNQLELLPASIVSESSSSTDKNKSVHHADKNSISDTYESLQQSTEINEASYSIGELTNIMNDVLTLPTQKLPEELTNIPQQSETIEQISSNFFPTDIEESAEKKPTSDLTRIYYELQEKRYIQPVVAETQIKQRQEPSDVNVKNDIGHFDMKSFSLRSNLPSREYRQVFGVSDEIVNTVDDLTYCVDQTLQPIISNDKPQIKDTLENNQLIDSAIQEELISEITPNVELDFRYSLLFDGANSLIKPLIDLPSNIKEEKDSSSVIDVISNIASSSSLTTANEEITTVSNADIYDKQDIQLQVSMTPDQITSTAESTKPNDEILTPTVTDGGIIVSKTSEEISTKVEDDQQEQSSSIDLLEVVKHVLLSADETKASPSASSEEQIPTIEKNQEITDSSNIADFATSLITTVISSFTNASPTSESTEDATSFVNTSPSIEEQIPSQVARPIEEANSTTKSTISNAEVQSPIVGNETIVISKPSAEKEIKEAHDQEQPPSTGLFEIITNLLPSTLLSKTPTDTSSESLPSVVQTQQQQSAINDQTTKVSQTSFQSSLTNEEQHHGVSDFLVKALSNVKDTISNLGSSDQTTAPSNFHEKSNQDNQQSDDLDNDKEQQTVPIKEQVTQTPKQTITSNTPWYSSQYKVAATEFDCLSNTHQSSTIDQKQEGESEKKPLCQQLQIINDDYPWYSTYYNIVDAEAKIARLHKQLNLSNEQPPSPTPVKIQSKVGEKTTTENDVLQDEQDNDEEGFHIVQRRKRIPSSTTHEKTVSSTILTTKSTVSPDIDLEPVILYGHPDASIPVSPIVSQTTNVTSKKKHKKKKKDKNEMIFFDAPEPTSSDLNKETIDVPQFRIVEEQPQKNIEMNDSVSLDQTLQPIISNEKPQLIETFENNQSIDSAIQEELISEITANSTSNFELDFRYSLLLDRISSLIKPLIDLPSNIKEEKDSSSVIDVISNINNSSSLTTVNEEVATVSNADVSDKHDIELEGSTTTDEITPSAESTKSNIEIFIPTVVDGEIIVSRSSEEISTKAEHDQQQRSSTGLFEMMKNLLPSTLLSKMPAERSSENIQSIVQTPHQEFTTESQKTEVSETPLQSSLTNDEEHHGVFDFVVKALSNVKDTISNLGSSDEKTAPSDFVEKSSEDIRQSENLDNDKEQQIIQTQEQITQIPKLLINSNAPWYSSQYKVAATEFDRLSNTHQSPTIDQEKEDESEKKSLCQQLQVINDDYPWYSTYYNIVDAEAKIARLHKQLNLSNEQSRSPTPVKIQSKVEEKMTTENDVLQDEQDNDEEGFHIVKRRKRIPSSTTHEKTISSTILTTKSTVSPDIDLEPVILYGHPDAPILVSPIVAQTTDTTTKKKHEKKKKDKNEEIFFDAPEPTSTDINKQRIDGKKSKIVKEQPQKYIEMNDSVSLDQTLQSIISNEKPQVIETLENNQSTDLAIQEELINGITPNITSNFELDFRYSLLLDRISSLIKPLTDLPSNIKEEKDSSSVIDVISNIGSSSSITTASEEITNDTKAHVSAKQDIHLQASTATDKITSAAESTKPNNETFIPTMADREIIVSKPYEEISTKVKEDEQQPSSTGLLEIMKNLLPSTLLLKMPTETSSENVQSVVQTPHQESTTENQQTEVSDSPLQSSSTKEDEHHGVFDFVVKALSNVKDTISNFGSSDEKTAPSNFVEKSNEDSQQLEDLDNDNEQQIIPTQEQITQIPKLPITSNIPWFSSQYKVAATDFDRLSNEQPPSAAAVKSQSKVEEKMTTENDVLQDEQANDEEGFHIVQRRKRIPSSTTHEKTISSTILTTKPTVSPDIDLEPVILYGHPDAPSPVSPIVPQTTDTISKKKHKKKKKDKNEEIFFDAPEPTLTDINKQRIDAKKSKIVKEQPQENIETNDSVSLDQTLQSIVSNEKPQIIETFENNQSIDSAVQEELISEITPNIKSDVELDFRYSLLVDRISSLIKPLIDLPSNIKEEKDLSSVIDVISNVASSSSLTTAHEEITTVSNADVSDKHDIELEGSTTKEQLTSSAESTEPSNEIIIPTMVDRETIVSRSSEEISTKAEDDQQQQSSTGLLEIMKNLFPSTLLSKMPTETSSENIQSVAQTHQQEHSIKDQKTEVSKSPLQSSPTKDDEHHGVFDFVVKVLSNVKDTISNLGSSDEKAAPSNFLEKSNEDTQQSEDLDNDKEQQNIPIKEQVTQIQKQPITSNMPWYSSQYKVATTEFDRLSNTHQSPTIDQEKEDESEKKSLCQQLQVINDDYPWYSTYYTIIDAEAKIARLHKQLNLSNEQSRSPTPVKIQSKVEEKTTTESDVLQDEQDNDEEGFHIVQRRKRIPSSTTHEKTVSSTILTTKSTVSPDIDLEPVILYGHPDASIPVSPIVSQTTNVTSKKKHKKKKKDKNEEIFFDAPERTSSDINKQRIDGKQSETVKEQPQEKVEANNSAFIDETFKHEHGQVNPIPRIISDDQKSEFVPTSIISNTKESKQIDDKMNESTSPLVSTPVTALPEDVKVNAQLIEEQPTDKEPIVQSSPSSTKPITKTIHTNVTPSPKEEEQEDNEGFQIVHYRKRIFSAGRSEQTLLSTPTSKEILSPDIDEKIPVTNEDQSLSTSVTADSQSLTSKKKKNKHKKHKKELDSSSNSGSSKVEQEPIDQETILQSHVSSSSSIIEDSNIQSSSTLSPTINTTTISKKSSASPEDEEDDEDNEGFQVVSYRKRITSATRFANTPPSPKTKYEKNIGRNIDHKRVVLHGRHGSASPSPSTSRTTVITKTPSNQNKQVRSKQDKKQTSLFNTPPRSASAETHIITSTSTGNSIRTLKDIKQNIEQPSPIPDEYQQRLKDPKHEMIVDVKSKLSQSSSMQQSTEKIVKEHHVSTKEDVKTADQQSSIEKIVPSTALSTNNTDTGKPKLIENDNDGFQLTRYPEQIPSSTISKEPGLISTTDQKSTDTSDKNDSSPPTTAPETVILQNTTPKKISKKPKMNKDNSLLSLTTDIDFIPLSVEETTNRKPNDNIQQVPQLQIIPTNNSSNSNETTLTNTTLETNTSQITDPIYQTDDVQSQLHSITSSTSATEEVSIPSKDLSGKVDDLFIAQPVRSTSTSQTSSTDIPSTTNQIEKEVISPETLPAKISIESSINTEDEQAKTSPSKKPTKRRKKKPHTKEKSDDENVLTTAAATKSNIQRSDDIKQESNLTTIQKSKSTGTTTTPQSFIPPPRRSEEINNKLDLFLPEYIRQQINTSQTNSSLSTSSSDTIPKKKSRPKMLTKDHEAKSLLTNEFDNTEKQYVPQTTTINDEDIDDDDEFIVQTFPSPIPNKSEEKPTNSSTEQTIDNILSRGFYLWLQESQALTQKKDNSTNIMQNIVIQPVTTNDDEDEDSWNESKAIKPTYMTGIHPEKRIHITNAYSINHPESISTPSWLIAQSNDNTFQDNPEKFHSDNEDDSMNDKSKKETDTQSNSNTNHHQQTKFTTDDVQDFYRHNPSINFDDWAHFLEHKNSYHIENDLSTSLECFYTRTFDEDTLLSDTIPIHHSIKNERQRYGDFLSSNNDESMIKLPLYKSKPSKYFQNLQKQELTSNDDEILISHSNDGLSRRVKS